MITKQMSTRAGNDDAMKNVIPELDSQNIRTIESLPRSPGGVITLDVCLAVKDILFHGTVHNRRHRERSKCLRRSPRGSDVDVEGANTISCVWEGEALGFTECWV